MFTPTRFTGGGVTTAAGTEALGYFGMPDPTKWHSRFLDFDNFTAGDWVITRVGTTPTEALTAVDGGALLLTTSAGATDSTFLQSTPASFAITSGKRAFFKTRFKASDATLSQIVVGLQVADTTPLAVTDGIFFQKASASASLDFYTQKDATTGQSAKLAVGTLAADTYITLGWAYVGDAVYAFVNDNLVARVSTASSFLPDAVLSLSFGLQNGEAAAKTLTMDYLFAATER